MLKNYTYLLGLLCLCFLSCEEDDYEPITFTLIDDVAIVNQNNSVQINVLTNDVNLPSTGSFNTSTPTNGATTIVDANATPNNPFDDVVTYTPNNNYVGSDTFTYTVCNANNSCATATVTVNVQPVSPVNFDLNEIPYTNLSEYNFFEGDLSDMNPVYGVLPYTLNSTLFTDYALKKRFVWMPDNVKAAYENDYTTLDFPTGTILIKNFYYENVQPNNSKMIIETRLMIKLENEWSFANYVWNEDQTDATFTTQGSFVAFDWIENGTMRSVDYRVPSLGECFTCHNQFDTPLPLGPKPQNLNGDYDYGNNVIQNQLAKWIEFGYLEDNLPETILSTIDYKNTLEPLNLRLRSYLDINCSHCHSEQGYCEYRPMRLAFKDTHDFTNIGVCVEPDTNINDALTYIIAPGNTERSVMHYRTNTVIEQYRMPLLGRTLKHDEGVQLLEDWINSLDIECQ
jgi:uncharacterized repeat protein (TIGR03806 family)